MLTEIKALYIQGDVWESDSFSDAPPLDLIFFPGFRNFIFVICENGDSWTHCAFRNPVSAGSELYGPLIGNVKKKSFLGTTTKHLFEKL